MYVAKCEIKIGSGQGTFRLDRAIDIEIRKSTQLLADTALIRLPATAVMKDKKATTAVELANTIGVGMPVEIKVWYKGHEKQAITFSGYVKKVNRNSPVEIECEDKIGLLRQISVNKGWKDTNLEAILKDITGDVIPLAEGIPPIQLKVYYLKNLNGIEALQKIKDEFGLSIYMTADDRLYCGVAYQEDYGKATYILNGKGANVIETDRLRWQDQEDVQVCVKVIAVKEDNTCQIAVAGDSQGAVRVFRYHNIESEEQLRVLAEQELSKLKYTGYRGKITGFLLPGVIPGMTAELIDEKYAERGGRYFVESVRTVWGRNGCRNEVELGIRIV